MIQSIESIHQYEDGNVYVSAVIEDVVQTHAQTLYDPPEYGCAVCESSFTLEPDDILPDNEYELIQYLESLDLSWEVMDNTDYYLD
jgi:hypothetical protein